MCDSASLERPLSPACPCGRRCVRPRLRVYISAPRPASSSPDPDPPPHSWSISGAELRRRYGPAPAPAPASAAGSGSGRELERERRCGSCAESPPRVARERSDCARGRVSGVQARQGWLATELAVSELEWLRRLLGVTLLAALCLLYLIKKCLCKVHKCHNQ